MRTMLVYLGRFISLATDLFAVMFMFSFTLFVVMATGAFVLLVARAVVEGFRVVPS